MTIDKLSTAIQEAQHFISVAAAAHKRLQSDHTLSISGCRETGAARRASMDLTRALAELRKP